MPDHAVTQPSAGLSSSAITTIAPTDVGELPPDMLADATFEARYAVGEVLGEGGMGIVRTTADKRIGREVAMKLVRPGEGSRGDLKARFLREACVQGQLEHPSIVPVYDLARDPEGTLYFTMKRVRGASFEQIVDALRAGDPEAKKTYTRHKLLSAFASVCNAVDFAHARGVVHRDLKPGNVMLGDFGEVYVLDWGLAKVVGAPEPRLPSEPPAVGGGSDPGARTRHGATMGTPGYMAPEQVRGENVDARADVYALGAILFELLALERLHPQASAEHANASTLRGVDARPSARAPERDLPPELDDVCVAATALEPAQRTPTVRSMVEAVERYLEGDRDLERRRAMSRTHAATAESYAKRALDGGGPEATRARSLALREVGRAIALDPTNEDALRTLMRLMTEPPAEMPPEARNAMLHDARTTMRHGARIAAVAYMSWFLYLPLMIWIGVRDWGEWAACSAAWLAAALAAIFSVRNPSRDARPEVKIMVPAVTATALTSFAFGPYVIVPALAAIGSMLLQMPPNKRGRTSLVVLHCMAVAIPAVLQWTGVLRPSYLFRDGTMTILPNMLWLPPMQTNAFLLIASLALVITGSVILGGFRNKLTLVEERLHMQTWHLRQLVPEEARKVSVPTPPESLAVLPQDRAKRRP
jgi:eukaryotic-like serine/threonine-protein kinase